MEMIFLMSMGACSLSAFLIAEDSQGETNMLSTNAFHDYFIVINYLLQ